jgi:hypothetical protein
MGVELRIVENIQFTKMHLHGRFSNAISQFIVAHSLRLLKTGRGMRHTREKRSSLFIRNNQPQIIFLFHLVFQWYYFVALLANICKTRLKQLTVYSCLFVRKTLTKISFYNDYTLAKLILY